MQHSHTASLLNIEEVATRAVTVEETEARELHRSCLDVEVMKPLGFGGGVQDTVLLHALELLVDTHAWA